MQSLVPVPFEIAANPFGEMRNPHHRRIVAFECGARQDVENMFSAIRLSCA